MKKLCAMLLSVALVLGAALPFSSCDFDWGNSGKTDHVTSGGEQGDSETDPVTPGGEQGGQESEPAPKDPDYSRFSKTLQTVLTSDYYNGLIEEFNNTPLSGGNPDECDEHGNNSRWRYLCGSMEALPFHSLEKYGEDIEDIKYYYWNFYHYDWNYPWEDDYGGKECCTWADCLLYFYEDEPYEMYARVRLRYSGQDENSYWIYDKYETQYLIKYDLSGYKQEAEELKQLTYRCIKGNYIQANFLFQEIDKQIDPDKVELVSKFRIDESTYNGILNNFNSKDIIKDNIVEIDNYTITNIEQDKDDDETYYIDLTAINSVKYYGGSGISSKKIMNMKAKLRWSSYVSFPNGILKLGATNKVDILETSAPAPITCYDLVVKLKGREEYGLDEEGDVEYDYRDYLSKSSR